MGNGCIGKSEGMTSGQKASREIDVALRAEVNDKKIKILLLGTGDSGKSTFFKQIRKIHSEKELESETPRYVKVLRQNAKSSMQRIIVSCQERNIQLPKLADKLDAAITQSESDSLTPEVAKMIQTLWANDIVREAYDKRHELKIHIPANADYYFKNCSRFANPEFRPTFDDIMMAKIKTTGVQEAQFVSGNSEIVLVDVGGQRSERRKWLHCLDDVTAIIFLAAMDDYDSMLEEDGSTNRLQESLELFSTCTSSEHFSNKGWILFLNKKDLFERKIKTKPLSTYFPTLDPKLGSDYLECSQYLKDVYHKAFQGKHFFAQFTCALDTNHCEQVFSATQTYILTKLMENMNYNV